MLTNLGSTLVDREYPEGYESFMASHGIQHHVIGMRGTKKEAIPVPVMKSILRLVLDRQNHPLLIHCNHGKVWELYPLWIYSSG